MVSNLGNKQIMASNIRRHINSLGMNAKEFANELGFKYTTVLDWLNAKTYPRIDKIEIMANYFHVDKSDLVEEYSVTSSNSASQSAQNDRDKLLEELTTNYTKLDDKRKHKLVDTSRALVEERANDTVEEELFEYHVYEKLSAGIGTAYFEDRNYDTVYFDEEIDHDLASWVYGDSMEPDYLNGSVALIKGTSFDYDGAIYAVDWDGQSYIKKVYKEKDGLRLVSLNKKYADKFAPYDEEPRIIGKIVGNFMPMEN